MDKLSDNAQRAAFKASKAGRLRTSKVSASAMALLLGAGLATTQTQAAFGQVIIGDVTQLLGAGPYAPGALGIEATGDIVISGTGAVINSLGSTGLSAVTPGAVSAAVLDVTTTGAATPGVVIQGLTSVDLLTGGLVSTTGDDSAAIAVTTNGPVTVSSSVVQTSGADSNGVQLVSVGGPAILDASLIDTSGDRSIGALIEAAGDVDLEVGILRTDGAEAAGATLTTDPAACVVLGAGSCNITGTISEVTTGGFLAPGALVRAAGDIGLNVGVLRTEGNEAFGLDLATSPSACAVLGAGSCDTAFSVGDLRTLGLGSTGALVRATGLTTANIGVLRTEGDQAAGLDIAADPTACALLGSGACDVSATIDELSTEGANAAGVLIRAPADIGVDAGILRTLGANSAAVDLAADPTACILLGAGGCDTFLTADQISTAGADSPGALIRAGGPVMATVTQIRTLGLASPGLDIATDPLVCATLGQASCAVTAEVGDGGTTGGDSDVVEVDNNGPSSVDVGNGSTTGSGSSVVDVDGGAGPVVVDVENGSTSGPNSPVIDVDTTTGDQTIGVGTIIATGPGSDGIDAESGTGDIDITVRQQVTSADGEAIDVSTGGAVTVNILPGATVRGDEASVVVNAGAGSTINNDGTISANEGLAVNVDGGPTIINNRGRVFGRINLTDAGDVFNNSGRFDAVGGSDFGAGNDAFNNSGTVTTQGPAVFAGLETFNNTGLIDMRDGATDDSLSLPGAFNGQSGSRLAVDVNLGVDGTPADRLIVRGAATGVTQVTINDIGALPGVLNPDGVVAIDVGSAAAGAFVLAEPVSSGFVDYTLETDATSGDFELVGRPGQSVFELVSLGEASQNAWYRSGDAISDHTSSLRSAAAPKAAQPHGLQVWGQVFGGSRSREDAREFDSFGVSTVRAIGYDQSSIGAQFGVDTLRAAATGQVYGGVTAGFDKSDADLGAFTQDDMDSYNFGLYGGWFGERLWVDGIIKADRFDIDLTNTQVAYSADISGRSYGAEVKAGYRFGDADLIVEPIVTLAYVRTSIDGFAAPGATVQFDDAKSLRGKAGLRVSRMTGDLHPYAMLEAVKEFEGENTVRFNSGAFQAAFADTPADAYGLATIGIEKPLSKGGVFAQAQGAFGDVEGYGLRIGFHTRW